jgi:phosphohistidine phosphatase
VQTWEGVRGGFPSDIRVEISEDLYAADALALRGRLERLPETVEAVLVIGHSPGIDGLAVGLAGGGEEAALERMQAKFPTGGLATLAFQGRWSALSWGGAVVREFVVPRDLR